MSKKTRHYQHKLHAVAKTLDELARSLRCEGLEQPARSVETTIADLDWQREELEQVRVAAPDLRLVSS